MESIISQVEPNLKEGMTWFNYGAGPGKWRINAAYRNPNLTPVWNDTQMGTEQKPINKSI